MSEFKWISVKDELPKGDEEIVLMIYRPSRIANQHYALGSCNHFGMWRDRCLQQIEGVTHWSHIPPTKPDELIGFEEWVKDRCLVDRSICLEVWMAAIEWASKRESLDKL